MDSLSSSLAKEARVSFARRSLTWIGVALLAAPLSILLHELGHFVVGSAFGFPNLVLHYVAVTSRAAETGFPLWQQGLEAAAGPLVTLAIVLSGCYATIRAGVHAWTVIPAFAAGSRSVAIGVTYLVVRVRYPAPQGNFDEGIAAHDLGLSPVVVVVVSIVLIIGAWAFLIRRIPRGQRAFALASIAVGTVSGLALYIGWLGPLLLP